MLKTVQAEVTKGQKKTQISMAYMNNVKQSIYVYIYMGLHRVRHDWCDLVAAAYI